MVEKNEDENIIGKAVGLNLSDLFEKMEEERKKLLQKYFTDYKDDPKISSFAYIEEHRTEVFKNEDLRNGLLSIQKKEQDAVFKEREKNIEILKIDANTIVNIECGNNLQVQCGKIDNLKMMHLTTEIPESNAPVCLMLALQRENGRNMPDQDALYMNINYDEKGKITHITHPEPLEIEGEKCGFTVNGVKYYLKADLKTLDALKKAASQNKGQELGEDGVFLRPKGASDGVFLGEEKKKKKKIKQDDNPLDGINKKRKLDLEEDDEEDRKHKKRKIKPIVRKTLGKIKKKRIRTNNEKNINSKDDFIIKDEELKNPAKNTKSPLMSTEEELKAFIAKYPIDTRKGVNLIEESIQTRKAEPKEKGKKGDKIKGPWSGWKKDWEEGRGKG